MGRFTRKENSEKQIKICTTKPIRNAHWDTAHSQNVRSPQYVKTEYDTNFTLHFSNRNRIILSN